MPRPKKEKEEIVCEICGKVSDRQLYSINMETISGRAGWHLPFNPILHGCATCAGSLNVYIRAWYEENNHTNKNSKFVK